jgi:hypothetical protein
MKVLATTGRSKHIEKPLTLNPHIPSKPINVERRSSLGMNLAKSDKITT